MESDHPSEDGLLRVSAELREVERQLSATRFRVLWLKFLALPVFVLALVAMIVGLILGWSEPAPLVTGVLGLLGGTAGLVSLSRSQEERRADLEWRREKLSLANPEFQSAVAPLLADPPRESPGGAI